MERTSTGLALVLPELREQRDTRNTWVILGVGLGEVGVIGVTLNFVLVHAAPLALSGVSQGMVRTQSEPLPWSCGRSRVRRDQSASSDLGRQGRQRQQHWCHRFARRGN